ncbi:hypothetical protein C8J57DRAFT_1515534 [Mycena rebaudengoi]|nr:hypothetical protein C8J57DRAFT_1515534 [Mycena rebaudengoi]
MTTTLRSDQSETTAARSASDDVDLASMIVLVGHLAAASVQSASLAAAVEERTPTGRLSMELVAATLETTRLAVEVQNRLPAVLAAVEIAAAQAAQVYAHAAEPSRPPGPPFTEGVAITPDALETFIPESGNIWYVVIIGRQPGLYRTPAEANLQTHGVPGQFSQKKTSRREALAFYRERYGLPPPHGVQKWVELAGLPSPMDSVSVPSVV